MTSSVGLDIGSTTIKLIEINRDGDKTWLVAAGTCPMPPKALSSTLQADTEAIAIAVKQLLHQTGTKSRNLNIALPDSKVFTRVIEIPQLSDRELSSAIKWEAEQYIPMPLDQVNIDYTVLRDSKETGTNKMEVLLVAAPKVLVDKYTAIIELAGASAISAETEIIATSRAVVRSVPNVKTLMVVSLGMQTTEIAVLKNGVLMFTRTVSAGGEAITRAIAQSLDLTQPQAEEYKRTYGLQTDKLEGKIAAAAKPIMDTIVMEIRRALTYFSEKHSEQHIETVLLSGGTAKVPGMVVYLAQILNMEVQFANPWAGIGRDARFNVLMTEGPNFCVAVGLALR